MHNSGSPQDRECASILISDFLQYDRYCNITMHYALKVHHSLIWQASARPPRSTLKLKWPDILPFELHGQQKELNVERLVHNGGYHLLPRSDVDFNCVCNGPHCGDRERMSLDIEQICCIWIEEEEEAFNSTGHYPIFAGVNSSGERQYLACVKNESKHPDYFQYSHYFAMSRDGDRFVTYTDAHGKPKKSSEF